MSKPLIVSIPHRLGREEAVRRIKSGFATARGNYSAFLTFQEEAWTGDRLAFNVSALGQARVRRPRCRRRPRAIGSYAALAPRQVREEGYASDPQGGHADARAQRLT